MKISTVMLSLIEPVSIALPHTHLITVFKCECGNEIETGSINDNITVEICNNCHPFYTGQQKILDSEGRVERFNKRYGKKA